MADVEVMQVYQSVGRFTQLCGGQKGLISATFLDEAYLTIRRRVLQSGLNLSKYSLTFPFLRYGEISHAVLTFSSRQKPMSGTTCG